MIQQTIKAKISSVIFFAKKICYVCFVTQTICFHVWKQS